ncbi:hypothetical protein NDU88_007016 [Pleurodeles waltl]|uniref:Uncharacterized protein n=1 Tax=Pleurodeles waltl TaxID=8319 RepID=A0AAV7MDX7_PLEWA|nr:hypothetical protein NDU88_007016 [Pleurodeles waltl]
MAEKRSQTEELLEALILRMDAMDQAIAILKAQTSSSGVVASSNEDVPQRAGIPSSEVIPLAPKRMRGQRKGKGTEGRRTEVTPAQVGNSVNIASMRPEVSTALVVDAGHAERGGGGRVRRQSKLWALWYLHKTQLRGKTLRRPLSGIL